MDITPIIPQDMNVITSYGEGSFVINNEEYNGSIILSPNSVFKWEIESFENISTKELKYIEELNPEILIIGCGDTHQPIPIEIRKHFDDLNIGVEIMTTGAACRTYNVLLAEGREVIAALVKV